MDTWWAHGWASGRCAVFSCFGEYRLRLIDCSLPTVRSPATSDSWVAILPSDLLVSRRQKRNGTSWTRFGSTGPALVTALVLNGYLDQ